MGISRALTLGAVATTRNKSRTLGAFALSLSIQSRVPDRIVLVDDASLDGTAELLASFPAAWDRILLSKRLGQSAARNAGLRAIRTDLVIFLDADIVMAPDMLAELEGALASDPGASFAYCGYRRMGALSGELSAPTWDCEALRRSNFASTMSLVRMEHLPHGGFDESLDRFEDWDLWLRMAAAGRRGTPVKRALFEAWYHRGDISLGPSSRRKEASVRRADRRRRGILSE